MFYLRIIISWLKEGIGNGRDKTDFVYVVRMQIITKGSVHIWMRERK